MLCSFAVNIIASIVQIYLPTFLKEVLFLGAVDVSPLKNYNVLQNNEPFLEWIL